MSIQLGGLYPRGEQMAATLRFNHLLFLIALVEISAECLSFSREGSQTLSNPYSAQEEKAKSSIASKHSVRTTEPFVSWLA